MPSQRPFFLSSFLASFRQQAPSLQATAQQPSKHTTQASSSSSTAGGTSSSATSRAISANATSSPTAAAAAANVAIHSPRGSAGGPIPIPHDSRRRGSDSSSEGFRDAIGAEKWYIGGRTAGGEEKFFKLGVIRRVRSNDGLSLDRLSL